MKCLASCFALAVIILTVSLETAQAEDVPNLVVCSTAEILECLPVEACERVNADSIGAPNFLRLNLAKGLISRKPPGGEEITSPIRHTAELDGRLILQGAESGIEGTSRGLGWTISIDKQTGAMVLTGSGDGVAFVVFGACMIP